MFNLNLIFCVFLAVFIKSGLAIQCYMCDSSSNPGCHMLQSGHNVRIETCTHQNIGQDAASWLKDLLKIAYFTSTESHKDLMVPMSCQKIIAFNDLNEKTTYRGCQLNTSLTNPCTVMIKKIKNNPSFKIDFCEVCEKDLCNSTYRIKMCAPLFILMVYAVIKNSFL